MRFAGIGNSAGDNGKGKCGLRKVYFIKNFIFLNQTCYGYSGTTMFFKNRYRTLYGVSLYESYHYAHAWLKQFKYTEKSIQFHTMEHRYHRHANGRAGNSSPQRYILHGIYTVNYTVNSRRFYIGSRNAR